MRMDFITSLSDTYFSLFFSISVPLKSGQVKY